MNIKNDLDHRFAKVSDTPGNFPPAVNKTHSRKLGADSLNTGPPMERNWL